MISNNNRYKTTVWWVWGIFDAIYLGWYIFESIARGKIPYISDGISTFWLLSEQGVSQTVMAVLSWTFQMSIIFTCVLYFSRRDCVKWLSYLQTPLRLVFLVPSVSVLLVGVQFFPNYTPVLMVFLIFISELIKCWSLWKFGSGQAR